LFFFTYGGVALPNMDSLHEDIVSAIIATTGKNEDIQPFAILVGGGTASGKTQLRKEIIEEELNKNSISYSLVDADEIKLHLPHYHELLVTDPCHAAALVHKESTLIRDLALERLIQMRTSFLYEGTMAKSRSYLDLVKKLKKADYLIHIWIADVPLKVARNRSKDREKITGRRVPDSVILNTHKQIPRTFLLLKNVVHTYQLFDTQAGYKLIFSNSYFDMSLYPAFLRKGIE
jgi:predicted kinase